MPALVARRTAATEEWAPALSRIIAAAFDAMAASIRLSCRYASSSCASTRTRYPRETARSAAASASALKNGLSCEGTITTISFFEVCGLWHSADHSAKRTAARVHHFRVVWITRLLHRRCAAESGGTAPAYLSAIDR